jgi:O-antigen ligase
MALRGIPGYDALVVASLVLPFIERSWRVRLVLYILTLLTLASLSRGSMLALFLIFTARILSSPSLRRPLISFGLKALLGFVLGAFLLSLMVPEFRGAVAIRWAEAGGFSLRRSLLSAAWEMFLAQPVVGIGSENFAEYLIARDAYPLGHPMSLPENLAPHNLFVQVAAENGILGAVGLCGLVWLVWRVLFRLESSRDWLPWIEGLRNVALVELIGVGLFGYAGGSARLQLGLFLGLALASLRRPLLKTPGAGARG